ncbi:MAG TPA: signal peptidase I [Rhodobacteraceae bacterium]|jgi:signal peptidase I|nr:signal peptidase I [Paracoccaceae bacterium]
MAKKTEKPEGIWELFKTVFWALIIAGLFRTLFFQPFWIPSGSMKDTLLIGDFLFVNKMAYGYSKHSCPFSACPFSGRILGSEPELGDVVVFRHPVNGNDFIKRLVGLPGDKVQMKNGVLHLNGEPVKLEPTKAFEETHEKQGSAGSFPRCENTPGVGGICTKSRMIETLPNGVSHSILNIGDQAKDNTGIYTVPEGHFFFMGDNRDNSTDSRFPQNAGGVGYVPFENIIGRADRIMFSSAGKSLFYFWTWRSDRYFKAVQ